MIKAIIFDLDGTIIDTESPWYEAARISYEEFGQELPLALYARCIGTTLEAFDPYQYIVTELKVNIDVAEFRAIVRRHYDKIMEQQHIRPGVKEMLNQAQAAGIKLALASSSPREWVERHLSELGLLPYFQVICTADDVPHVKPDPALYLKALAELNVLASDAIAIEDSPNGARAAHAAGITCFVTPNPVTSDLIFDMPHHRLDGLASVSLAQLQQIAEQGE